MRHIDHGGIEGFDVQQARVYYPALDGLRGLAALAVLVQHSHPILRDAFGGSSGLLGVEVFFVLSGFLITRILMADKVDGRKLSYFYMRRSRRIFPLYFLVLFVVALYWGMEDWWWWGAAYLTNVYTVMHDGITPLQHTWSLAVEEHFYLVWPVVVWLLPLNKVGKAACIGITFSASLAAFTAIISDHPRIDHWIYLLTPYRAASLLTGALLAYYESRIVHQPLSMLKLAAVLWVFGCIPLNMGEGIQILMPRLFIATSIVLAVIVASQTQNPVRTFLSCATLRHLGRISYGLYLWHLLYWTWFDASLSREGTLIMWGLTYVTALASWHLWEKWWLSPKAAKVIPQAKEKEPQPLTPQTTNQPTLMTRALHGENS